MSSIDNEISAAAAVLKTNARDHAGHAFDDASARALAQLVLEAAEAVREPRRIPAFRADG